MIKITELGSGEKINKIHKKWGDKSGISHKFLFKRKDEKFPVRLRLSLLFPLPLPFYYNYSLFNTITSHSHLHTTHNSSLTHHHFYLQKQHDPRAIVEDYTLEMRSTIDTSKKPSKQAETGRKTEADFLTLISNVLSVFAERVEHLFFQENAEDDFDTDMVAVTDDQTVGLHSLFLLLSLFLFPSPFF